MDSKPLTRAAAIAALALAAAAIPPLSDAADQNPWNPEVAIVWPHDTTGNATTVSSSQLANVSVWPTNVASCTLDADPTVDLFVATDNEPAGSSGITSQLIQRTVDSTRFASLEFNDVHADLAANPSSKFRFIAYSGGEPASNVWIHAADPRTIFPQQFLPSGYADPTAMPLDTRIQVVFPHDAFGNFTSVDSATRVNLAVDIFQHGYNLSVPFDATYQPQLMYAIGNNPMVPGPVANQKITYLVGTNSYPRWVLNDFPVQPGQQYHFMFVLARLGQTGSAYPTIWTHAADPRTLLPNPVPPPSCFPGPPPSGTPSLTPFPTITGTPLPTSTAPTATPTSTATPGVAVTVVVATATTAPSPTP